jgi:TPR repeat protein
MLRWLVSVIAVVIAVTGCGAPRSTAPQPGKPVASPAADPARYEHGDGVPRDYAKAAPLREEACKLGDTVSCRVFGDMVMHGRGVALDEDRGKQLLGAACDKGDGEACARGGRKLVAAHLPALKGACAKGQGGACFAVALALFDDPGEATVDDVRKPLMVACRANIPEACQRVIDVAELCKQLEAKPDTCEAAVAAYVAKPGKELGKEAFELELAMCKRGNATACAALPARAVGEADLCKAHDFGACMGAGYVGAIADEVAACDGGFAGACLRAARRLRADGHPDQVAHLLDRGCALHDSDACAEKVDPSGCAAFAPVQIPDTQRKPAGIAGPAVVIPDVNDSILYEHDQPGFTYAKTALAPEPLIDRASLPGDVARALRAEIERALPADRPSFAAASSAAVIDGAGRLSAVLHLGSMTQPLDLVACVRSLR